MLKQICQDVNCPPAPRVAAAQILLDRGWGRPDQHIEITAKIADQMSDEELNAELERIGKLIEVKAEPELLEHEPEAAPGSSHNLPSD